MRLLQQRRQTTDALAVVEHIVHQDHRPVKGADGAYLIGQRRVVGVGLDGGGAEIGLIDLVGAQRLGNGVRHRHATQDLSVGYADIRAEDAGRDRLCRYAVALGDTLEQPVVDDAGGQAQHQRAGLEAGQRRL